MANGGKVLAGVAVLAFTIGAVVLTTRPAKAAPGFGDLTGSVRDETGMPISGVIVTLGAYGTSTDSLGSFSFLEIPEGTYTMTFFKEGYETVYL